MSKVGVDDVPVANSHEDADGQFILDPSVWASPIKPNRSGSSNFNHFNSVFGTQEPPPLSRAPFPQRTTPFSSNYQSPEASSAMPRPMKICTLDEIERNIRTQQHEANIINNNSNNSNDLSRMFNSPIPLAPGHVVGPLPHQQMAVTAAPPGLRVPPPGFAPIPQRQPMDPAQMSKALKGPPPQQVMTPHMMQFLHQQQSLLSPQHRGLHPGHPMVPPQQMMINNNNNNSASNNNNFNKRLVMEIQQTHPMLIYNRPPMPSQLHHHQVGPPPVLPPPHPMFMQHPPHHHPGQMPPLLPHQPTPQMLMEMAMANGNMNKGGMAGMRRELSSGIPMQPGGQSPLRPVDEYANLMSQRDKQWLIGIQLMQLNTETPYIDDYYYTVYKERRMKGRENRIHKDNQLNHPFTQPQGSHAQLVLQSIGNKNSKWEDLMFQ